MNSASNTFERIQNEIRENLEREKELKTGHTSLNGVSYSQGDISATGANGTLPKTNGFTRRFIPNTNARGVMQKFFKNRGKFNNSTINAADLQNSFEPAKITIKKGENLRNGYVSAEEKIVKELLDFQKRETELREERRKSQPDLMRALELEENQIKNCNGSSSSILKSAKSLSNLYQISNTAKSVNGSN
uniref:Uncharacterized protein LOC114346074 n=1 Tax=Diabrotica virgifera virgifera TaxID=50390 RepID=A0A6P7H4R8_DIAVI